MKDYKTKLFISEVRVEEFISLLHIPYFGWYFYVKLKVLKLTLSVMENKVSDSPFLGIHVSYLASSPLHAMRNNL